MSLTNRNSGTHFLTLSAYNRFRMFSSRRSDSSISDAESIQSSQAAEEQGSTGDCLPTQCTEGEILSPPNLKAFTFKELKSATRNFRPDSLIGEGAFGYVFKGWIDEHTFAASKPGVGMVVAVKKFKPEGFHVHNAWLTEVRYLGQLHHPNLVKLIGFCSDGDNRLLVYEFMPRGSLDNHLFGRGVQSLSWATRIKVAIGAAKGLTFLHDAESQVIHRNVNSASILLDSDFNAKLSGFALAMAGPTGDMTDVFTDVMGTSGYAAPEYIATDPSKATSKPGLSSTPSTQTACSTPSTFTVPSCTHGSTGDCIPTPHTEDEILSYPNLKAFLFNELKSATRNFRPDSLIGEGGFGCVFKGWIDEQTFTASKPGVGMLVAVKKLKPEGFQGHNEWLTEVRYLGQLHHPNLVKLIGFCSDGDNRLLVYEFMPRGSLENHLFGRGPQPLSWATRIKVAIGAATGLAFLHDAECQVIYRDVKSSNILLDSDFNAKLSDFGLAKAGPTGDMTHVSTRIIGTQGYAAPEYIATGRLSAKADVYSFGVVLLELLSGRRAYEKSKSGTEQNLVDWARPYLDDKRKLFRIMDSKLEGQFPKKVAHAMANLVSVCIGNDPKLRPPMSEVLGVLEKLQDPNTAEKLIQTERAKSSRYRKKSPMRHNASPLRSTPGASPLRQTPGGSPHQQTHGRLSLSQTPGGSPLQQTPRRSPHRPPPRGSPHRPNSRGSPLPSNSRSPQVH